MCVSFLQITASMATTMTDSNPGLLWGFILKLWTTTNPRVPNVYFQKHEIAAADGAVKFPSETKEALERTRCLNHVTYDGDGVHRCDLG